MSDLLIPRQVLHDWLRRQLSATAADWLAEQITWLGDHPGERALYLAVSLVPRKLGKADLNLAAEDLALAERCRIGWNPRSWSVDQAGRIVLLLAAGGTEQQFAQRLEQLCNTADVGELIAFYRGLPLYPGQDQYVLRAAEGVRTNMKAVFEAVAHDNPYPAEWLPESAWNQMVLKALFIGSPLYPIVGLERRSNPVLMRMLCDYAHERWAAGRLVSPELWRCVGPHADTAALGDLERVLGDGAERDRRAAALALNVCPHPRAAELLVSVPEFAATIASGEFDWRSVALEKTE